MMNQKAAPAFEISESWWLVQHVGVQQVSAGFHTSVPGV